MMHMNRNPEYFLTVVREGNISRAAEKLYISQPSLSQHIAKLEEALHVKLLDRTKSPLELTPAGELYRNYLESSDFLHQKFQAELSGLNAERSLTVHLGIGSWRGSILLPKVLPVFLLQHPGVQVYLHEYPVSVLERMVQDGQVDFAVMNTIPGAVSDTLVTETIVYERILLVMNRNDPIALQFDHARNSGQPYDLQSLTTERLITLSKSQTVGRLVGNFLEKNRLSFPLHISTTNNATVLNLVSAGMGFCFLVEAGLAGASDYPDLVFFDLGTDDLKLPLSLCYRRNSFLSPAAHDLIRQIGHHCSTGETEHV